MKIIWVIGIIFDIWKITYFGWDFFPQSNTEIIVVGISLIIIVLALLSLKIRKQI